MASSAAAFTTGLPLPTFRPSQHAAPQGATTPLRVYATGKHVPSAKVKPSGAAAAPELSTGDSGLRGHGYLPEKAHPSAEGEGWVDRVRDLSQGNKSATCCYCGDTSTIVADEGSEPCNLNCNCDWAVAQAIWDLYGSDELLSAKRFFMSAIEASPRSSQLRQAYAMFLWKGMGEPELAELEFKAAREIMADEDEEVVISSDAVNNITELLGSEAYFLLSLPEVDDPATV